MEKENFTNFIAQSRNGKMKWDEDGARLKPNFYLLQQQQQQKHLSSPFRTRSHTRCISIIFLLFKTSERWTIYGWKEKFVF